MALIYDVELEEMVCDHEEAYLEPACCSPFQIGESGFVECGCHGQDSIICPALNCTGIEDWQIDELLERLS